MTPLNNVTAEQLEIINRVLDKVAPKFVFGSFEVEDIKQEALITVIQAIPKYNPIYPFEVFVRTHANYRLINFLRDNFHRNDPPCESCHNSVDGNTDHANGKYCFVYRQWKKRNANKASIARPTSLSGITDETHAHETFIVQKSVPIDEQATRKEFYNLIDGRLPIEYRKYFLQMVSGARLSKYRREQLIAEILKIVSIDEIDKMKGVFGGDSDDENDD